MRLRAEYLWEQEKYDEIHFNFTNGHKVEYEEWMNGKRINIQGNKTWWSEKALPSNKYNDFWNYLELIFTYAGTASQPIQVMFFQGGHPGHAVVIIDKAINEQTGESIFLLAQSYMPAQEIQILLNPNNPDLSPWFKFQREEIITPEWNFTINDLKRFKE